MFVQLISNLVVSKYKQITQHGGKIQFISSLLMFSPPLSTMFFWKQSNSGPVDLYIPQKEVIFEFCFRWFFYSQTWDSSPWKNTIWENILDLFPATLSKSKWIGRKPIYIRVWTDFMEYPSPFFSREGCSPLLTSYFSHSKKRRMVLSVKKKTGGTFNPLTSAPVGWQLGWSASLGSHGWNCLVPWLSFFFCGGRWPLRAQ